MTSEFIRGTAPQSIKQEWLDSLERDLANLTAENKRLKADLPTDLLKERDRLRAALDYLIKATAPYYDDELLEPPEVNVTLAASRLRVKTAAHAVELSDDDPIPF
jgi:hypothetical protein